MASACFAFHRVRATRKSSRVCVGAPHPGNYACVTVTDTGCGMDTSTQEHLFEPFFTTRMGQGGSGLGLHIVHNIVTGVLGGKIEVHSREGQGTVFMVQMPLVSPQ